MDFAGYDKTQLSLIIPDENVLGVLTPNHVEVGLTGADEVKRACCAHWNAEAFRNCEAGEKIVIITSDITRAGADGSHSAAGAGRDRGRRMQPEDVCVVFALGNHRPHTEEERKAAGAGCLRPREMRGPRQERLCPPGYTRAGTPVDIFRPSRRRTA